MLLAWPLGLDKLSDPKIVDSGDLSIGIRLSEVASRDDDATPYRYHIIALESL